jgi:ParB family chromosome partitioning protein
MVKKGLGRGFESLIPTDLLDESFDPTAGDDQKVSELRHIKIDDIVPDPEQPRRQFDQNALDELTESIRRHGILQPIVVTPHDGNYEIVAGERRYRAAKAAGLKTVPALVRTLSAQHKLELALIENLQRRDLNPLETATAYAKLREQFNMSLEEIGASVGGKSISAISNTLRLLRLTKAVQHAVAEGKITEGQARPLVDLDEENVKLLLPKIISEGWSARKVEEVVRETKQAAEPNRIQRGPQNAYAPVARELGSRFGTTVKVKTTAIGSGQIVISFKNENEFERIKEQLL